MARTTPAQKPRGAHRRISRGGLVMTPAMWRVGALSVKRERPLFAEPFAGRITTPGILPRHFDPREEAICLRKPRASRKDTLERGKLDPHFLSSPMATTASH